MVTVNHLRLDLLIYTCEVKNSSRKSVLKVTTLFTKKWALSVESFKFIFIKMAREERGCPFCALKSGCGNTGLVLVFLRAGNIRWGKFLFFAKSALGKPYISYFSVAEESKAQFSLLFPQTAFLVDQIIIK